MKNPAIERLFFVIGQIFDEKKYVCVRYKSSSKIALIKCDPCIQFRCGDGQCTLKQWRCNNVKNCLDGTDEVSILIDCSSVCNKWSHQKNKNN